jgi:hypothetical protein
MTTKEAIEWLRGIKILCNDGAFIVDKREALDMGIRALETLEKLEKWVEVQRNAD